MTAWYRLHRFDRSLLKGYKLKHWSDSNEHLESDKLISACITLACNWRGAWWGGVGCGVVGWGQMLPNATKLNSANTSSYFAWNYAAFHRIFQVSVKVWKKSFHVISEHMLFVKQIRSQTGFELIRQPAAYTRARAAFKLFMIDGILCIFGVTVRRFASRFQMTGTIIRNNHRPQTLFPRVGKMDFCPPRIQMGRLCAGDNSKYHYIFSEWNELCYPLAI